ncbi:hypothetical protein XU18_1935 [Perkinsela sp. CCAP 1560/4]|nr:hypothetical protein XU18_1935 [Perkinsela sp. CCAP 1560/4]|eukprot:KNH07403.1 hypothetical protein XU18_1935 [Perkinsela sp. CCAP 1560/4]
MCDCEYSCPLFVKNQLYLSSPPTFSSTHARFITKLNFRIGNVRRKCPIGNRRMEPQNVGLWIHILILLAFGLTAHCPFLGHPLNLIIAGLYVSLFLVIACTVLSLSLDLFASSRQNAPRKEGLHSQKYCPVCKRVATIGTKHCRMCHKCVPGFDHHCRWVSNCIGSANYTRFFVFCVVGTFTITLQVCVGGYLLSQSFANPRLFTSQLKKWYGIDSISSYRAILFLATFYEALCSVVLIAFLGFHVYLIHTKQTTYQWITQTRRRKGVSMWRSIFSFDCPQTAASQTFV